MWGPVLLGRWELSAAWLQGAFVKTGVYCPYCAAELFDPAAERCVSCGMFVAPELRAALAVRVPTARMLPLTNPAAGSQPVGGPVLEGIPVANPAFEANLADRRRWSESSPTDLQQTWAVWQTILFQTSLGLAAWAWAIVALGRLSYMPYAWVPAGLAIMTGLFGMTTTNRWFSLGAVVAAVVSIPVAGWVS